MNKFKRTKWKPGTVYGVPLKDGSFGIAQAIDEMMPTVIYVALFSDRFDTLPRNSDILIEENIISLTATWRQDLNNGSWAKIGDLDPVVSKNSFPNEKFASSGYVGAFHSDAGLLSDFLSAYHGLEPWNVMYEPDYWEQYLNTNKPKPSSILILNSEERSTYRKEVLGISDA